VSDVEVPLEALDSVLPAFVAPSARLFVKADVQGYEKEVLLGAKQILAQTIALQLEVSFVPLYDGQPLFQEIFDFVGHHGF
jgi:FkbM family methyltransferase